MTDTSDNALQGSSAPKAPKPGFLRLPSFEARMMLPALLLLASLSLFPFFFMIWMSFNEVSPIGGFSYDWVGLENWTDVFTDPAIRASWVTSLLYFVSALALEVILGVAIALLVYELIWGGNLIISLLIMPIFIAPVIVGLLGRFLVDSTFGLYSWALNVTGIFPGNVLGSGKAALIAVILMDAWEWTPLITLIVLAGLTSMPGDVIEAAKVDGASYLQRLRYVVMPMISGIIVVALLIRSMDLIRFFDIILITTNGGPADATKIVAIRLYENAFRFFELGYAAAIGLTMLLFTIIIANFFLRVLKARGLTQ
jgi:multiple sugar transport system permease protein